MHAGLRAAPATLTRCHGKNAENYADGSENAIQQQFRFSDTKRRHWRSTPEHAASFDRLRARGTSLRERPRRTCGDLTGVYGFNSTAATVDDPTVITSVTDSTVASGFNSTVVSIVDPTVTTPSDPMVASASDSTAVSVIGPTLVTFVDPMVASGSDHTVTSVTNPTVAFTAMITQAQATAAQGGIPAAPNDAAAHPNLDMEQLRDVFRRLASTQATPSNYAVLGHEDPDVTHTGLPVAAVDIKLRNEQIVSLIDLATSENFITKKRLAADVRISPAYVRCVCSAKPGTYMDILDQWELTFYVQHIECTASFFVVDPRLATAQGEPNSPRP